MSKLLKAVAKRHRPHVAAKMTPKHGYNETKHLFANDLAKAGIITGAAAKDLDECGDELDASGSNLGKAYNAAKSGMISPDKLNDADFVKSLLDMDGAVDSDTGNDGDDGDGELEDADSSITA